MGSYDNDWLFLDDDLFCVWIDEYQYENKESEGEAECRGESTTQTR